MRVDANRDRRVPRPTALLAIATVLAACTLPGGAPDAPADEGAVDAEGPVRTIAYGDGPEQVADLALPPGSAPDAGWPTVVLVHGGFWRDQFRRDLMTDLARDLADRDFASWNLEYRRVGPTGGGFPGTLLDVAAGTDHLAAVAEHAPIDLDRVAVVGHSAGGHLALWLGSRARLPTGAPGAAAPLRPCAVIAQAPVASLVDAVPLGDGAVTDFIGGGPEEVAERYAVADPIALVGHGVPVLLVHGRSDETVPVDQSERYEAAAGAAGDPVELVTGSGDHFAVIDPRDPLWDAQVAFLERRC